jgi:hypothetical protein
MVAGLSALSPDILESCCGDVCFDKTAYALGMAMTQHSQLSCADTQRNARHMAVGVGWCLLCYRVTLSAVMPCVAN